MGIKKNALLRDVVRVIIANLLEAQREWALVVKEMGADPVGAVEYIWKNRKMLPNIGYDRMSLQAIKDLFGIARATAPTSSESPAYFVRYLKAKEPVYHFRVTPTDEKNLMAMFSVNSTFEDLLKKLYEYLNKTAIKRAYDAVYVKDVHRRKLASVAESSMKYRVVLSYLNNIDRGV